MQLRMLTYPPHRTSVNARPSLRYATLVDHPLELVDVRVQRNDQDTSGVMLESPAVTHKLLEAVNNRVPASSWTAEHSPRFHEHTIQDARCAAPCNEYNSLRSPPDRVVTLLLTCPS